MARPRKANGLAVIDEHELIAAQNKVEEVQPENTIKVDDISSYESEIINESVNKDLEIDELKSKIDELTKQLTEKQDVIDKLNMDISILNGKIETIQNESDDLLLKNSELELEISKVRIEKVTPKTNNVINYTQIPQNNRKPQKIYTKYQIPKQGLNGYQEWR